jgi:hypothetical protein
MNTPRIPVYTPQVGTPQARIAAPSASVPGQFRMDLSGFDQFIASRRRAQEEEDLNDARSQLAAEEPQAQLAMAQKFDQIKTTWTPESAPIPEQMAAYIDEYITQAEKRIKSPKARELLIERGNEFKLHYGLQGFAYESGARKDARVATYEQGFTDAARAGVVDPASFGRSIVTLKSAIEADTGLPEQAKAAFIREQSEKAALTVARSRAENDPERAARYAGSLLGITEPVAPSGVRSGDIVAEIVKRESGGRMYGAGGEVLRGPAITTKGGQTIHAYGPYQMLESSAKSQAAKAGVEWNPELFYRGKTGDPVKDAEARQYHDLLGQSYIKDQLDEFGGDPVLVAAAHNMGPAATRGWAAGVPYQTQSGKWWYPKGPKDMANMPEETRKYVQGLGIEEKPVTVQPDPLDPNDEGAIPFKLLSPEALIQVRNQAMSNLAEQRRQESEALKIQSDLFKQRVKDIEAAAKNGDTITLPSDQELTTFMGPAEAAITKQRLLNYQQMGAGLKALPSMSNAELDAITRMPPPEGTEDRANRQFVHDTMTSRAGQIRAARNADPGQAAQDTRPQVSSAYSAWTAAANDFYSAGAQATPEMYDAMAKAQASYVRTSFAQQRQWGIDKPMLPKPVIEKMAQGFIARLDRDPEQAAQSLLTLPELLGNDAAVEQVAERIGPLGHLALDGVPGLTLAKIRAQQQSKPSEQMKLIEGVTTADIDREVRNAFAPFFSTLAIQGDRATPERYRVAANQLVLDSVIRGESPGKAAELAYNELFADRNAVNGTYRVDTTKYDAAKVDAGLGAILNAFTPEAFQVIPEPGFTLEESQVRKLRTVKQKARWVNTGDGQSVYLMHDTGPVLNRNGVPIRIKFEDATRSAPVAAPLSTSFRQAKGF